MKPLAIQQIIFKNLPLPFLFQEEPQFPINRIERHKENIFLYYTYESRGKSSYFNNKDAFKEFPSLIKVVAGGWYGDGGRWSTLQKFEGRLLCTNAKIKKHKRAKHPKPFFCIQKSFWGKQLKISFCTISGYLFKIKCSKVIAEDYSAYLYNYCLEKWIRQTVYQASTRPERILFLKNLKLP